MPDTPVGRLHHVEIWVVDYPRAKSTIGWVLERLGYHLASEWGHGGSWQGAGEYIVLESGPDVSGPHERRRAGLNHLAFVAGPASNVDALADAALGQGWVLMFPDRHPYAGGAGHYAAYLENADGFEIELVAGPAPQPLESAG
ncbi:VOC family protein [Arthrobacter sp. PAMC 25486]|uniref:VOC family protein n=1 Tax=Arthrobacter sp. PAMC 25486 TaxID=1494608 RepID=UPI00056FBFF8|nr:VOC family protein [Arthrobacter sp. PAMC 25486]